MRTDGWTEEHHYLKRSFQFNDFKEAFAFLAKVALLQEEQQHHAEWFNVYNRVELKMQTHDAGNIVTEKDHRLAASINQVL